MDNLSAHKGERVRELIEKREAALPATLLAGSQPHRGGFQKMKDLIRKSPKARARETLLDAMGTAISVISARDARGFFDHCGYGTPGQSL
jgi:hypothetical protein